MQLRISATTQDGPDVVVTIDHFPDHCPVCHHGIEPKFTKLARVVVGNLARIVFLCPRIDCQTFFISVYTQRPASQAYFYEGSYPNLPEEHEFSENITAISLMFCKIYNEAENAEKKGWKLIAGPGYRKALEFLVKDYLCGLRPADAEKIKTTQLGPCIATFVEEDRVKEMAKRAAWLGNDETHYTRKWEDRDLEDLKEVIELTRHWIEMDARSKKVLKDMPEGRKKDS